jgi:hypothetical protein
MNSDRLPKFLTLLGLAMVVAGVTFKLNHLIGAEQLFNAGAVVLVIGLVGWGVAVLRRKSDA